AAARTAAATTTTAVAINTAATARGPSSAAAEAATCAAHPPTAIVVRTGDRWGPSRAMRNMPNTRRSAVATRRCTTTRRTGLDKAAIVTNTLRVGGADEAHPREASARDCGRTQRRHA